MNLSAADVVLGQGTLRPDLIESASHLVTSNASTIRTHHSDTDLVRALGDEGKVVKPLKDFHKDEVRKLGRDLGLAKEFVDRHPFHGQGLSVRILEDSRGHRCVFFKGITVHYPRQREAQLKLCGSHCGQSTTLVYCAKLV